MLKASPLRSAIAWYGFPNSVCPTTDSRQGNLPTIARVLGTACAEGGSLRTAFEGWLQQQDYRFIERLLEAMRRD